MNNQIQINKIELENLANYNIRKGFDKFINKTLEHFNFNKITEKESKIIINFINSSNSKLSESYWILRTNLSRNEFINLLNEYKKKFIESPYKHTNRKNVQHKFQKINKSRGYSGYVNINNKMFYCRSQIEFIYIHYIHSIFPSSLYRIEMEEKIYYINNISYKPDIFIYNNIGKLIKIYEIKPDKYYNKKYDKFIDFFKKLNIEFEILYNSQDILKTHKDIKEKLIIWKQTAYLKTNMSGCNNPRYGCKLSDETKKKIGLKTKERNKNPEYKQYFIQQVKKSMASEEVKEKIRNAKKKNIKI